MIGHVNAIDPPVWSLFVEMRISLMFPFIFMLVLRTNVIISLFLGLTYSILASRLAHDGSALVVDFANTSRFVYLFVVGAVLAVPNNRSVLLLKGPVIKVAVFLVAICLIEYRFSPWPLPIRNYIPSIGVALLFLSCLSSASAAQILERTELLFLGRISYGLYLIHYPILILFLVRPRISCRIWSPQR
jgi:peptidoglycan/LPS O-acetylase OafA/YrhL